ncbi:MAG: hypothetical protein GAK45_01729 [Pseudomonas citronellolis]|nr:MAG: hypothetical protein GAK45_01729 [Pseudomonas citronellolis]
MQLVAAVVAAGTADAAAHPQRRDLDFTGLLVEVLGAALAVLQAGVEQGIGGGEVGRVDATFGADCMLLARVRLGFGGRAGIDGRQRAVEHPVLAVLDDVVVIGAGDDAAFLDELAMGSATDRNQFNAVLGLRALAAEIVDRDLGGAGLYIALDDQFVGGRTVAGQRAVHDQMPASAAVVAVDGQGMEAATVIEGDGAGAVQGLQVGVAGDAPGAAVIEVELGRIDDGAIELRMVLQVEPDLIGGAVGDHIALQRGAGGLEVHRAADRRLGAVVLHRQHLAIAADQRAVGQRQVEDRRLGGNCLGLLAAELGIVQLDDIGLRRGIAVGENPRGLAFGAQPGVVQLGGSAVGMQGIGIRALGHDLQVVGIDPRAGIGDQALGVVAPSVDMAVAQVDMPTPRGKGAVASGAGGFDPHTIGLYLRFAVQPV